MHEPDPPRSRRQDLSRERVVEAAIAVIDESGLEGLTMRRLGDALGADPMAAYLHVRDKAELLDAVVESVAARLVVVPPIDAGQPIEGLVARACALRAILLEHPNLAPLVASRPLPQAQAPEIVVAGVEGLRAIGFAERDIPVVFDALVTFAFGFVLQETGAARRRADLGTSFEDQQRRLLAQVADRPGDTTVAEAVIERRLAGATDEEFETGIRAMVHGLRAGLGRRQAPPPP